MKTKYQIYGSSNSLDTDLMVFVDSLGTIEQNKQSIEKYKTELQPLFSNKIDVHLAVVKDGQIVDISHGTYDECNNSLFYTYKNHKQHFDNVITKVYDRSRGTNFYYFKLIRVARFILSFFSREPELRSKIKSALRGDLKERIEVLKLIDFTKYTDFPHKKESKQDIYKVCAFQFAQIMGLVDGYEIYTKQYAISLFNNLEPFINRKNVDDKLYMLNNLLELYITICETEMIKNPTMDLYEIMKP